MVQAAPTPPAETPTRKRNQTVARTVLSFAGLVLVVLLLVAGVGIAVLRKVATDESIQQARELGALSARIVQPRIDDGLVTGDAEASVKVASIVNDAVLHDPIVAVKIYETDGTVVYSSDLKVLGQRFPNVARIVSGLAPGEIHIEQVDPSLEENRDVQGGGSLLASFVPIQTPDGTTLVLETYERSASVANSRQQLLSAFAPVLLVALIAMALLLVPLAWVLARRVERASQQREAALKRAISVSDTERRRIAGDIHDGPVQEMAGLALGLSAKAKLTRGVSERAALEEAAAAVRGSIRTLRSAIVGVYPPNVEAAGLGPALADLAARLQSEGLTVEMEVADPKGYGPQVDELLFRACREGLRNVEEHAGATHVAVRIHRDGGRAVLEVQDNGRGIPDAETGRRRYDGHVGVQILREIVQDGGGTMSVRPSPDRGTILRAEVPIP